MHAFNHCAQRGTPLSNRRAHILLQYVRSCATRAFSGVLHRERCQKVSCALRAVAGGDERENVREWNRSWAETHLSTKLAGEDCGTSAVCGVALFWTSGGARRRTARHPNEAKRLSSAQVSFSWSPSASNVEMRIGGELRCWSMKCCRARNPSTWSCSDTRLVSRIHAFAMARPNSERPVG